MNSSSLRMPAKGIPGAFYMLAMVCGLTWTFDVRAEGLGTTLDTMMSTDRSLAPPASNSESLAPLDKLMVPQTRTISGSGNRQLFVTCPCDVFWQSDSNDFTISVMPEDGGTQTRSRTKHRPNRISSQTVVNLMQGVRGHKHVAARSGNGRGRVHLSTPAEHQIRLTATGPWKLTVMTLP